MRRFILSLPLLAALTPLHAHAAVREWLSGDLFHQLQAAHAATPWESFLTWFQTLMGF